MLGNYRGLEEIRPVVERGVSFVQFESIAAASTALERLTSEKTLNDVFKSDKVRITYANK